MYLIVLGAGPVGAALVQQALEGAHDVVLIEADESIAQEMAQRFDASVLNASIAQGDILEEANAAEADALVATTDDDAANLMAMVLGREAGIETLVSVVNDAHHRRMFEGLGAHVLIDPEAIVANYLYGILCRPEVTDSVALPGGGFAFELALAEDAPLVGQTLESAREKGVPETIRIVWVRRDRQTVQMAPDARLEPGDRLTVFAPEPLDEPALRAFGSTQKRERAPGAGEANG